MLASWFLASPLAAQSALAVTPSTFTFVGDVADATLPAQSVQIRNAGTRALKSQVLQAPWLLVSPTTTGASFPMSVNIPILARPVTMQDASLPDFAAIMRGIRPRGFGVVPYRLVVPTTGRAYAVAPTGHDGNPGTAAAPFRTINKAAQVALAGDVVTIADGTYQESVTVRNNGTLAAPITFQAEHRGGVVLTGGQYTWQPAGWTGGKISTNGYVTLRGLIFRAYASTANGEAAVRGSLGWRIADCWFDRPGRNGLDLRGDAIVLTQTTINDAFQHAFVAWGPANKATGPTDPAYVGIRGLQVTDLILHHNYAAGMSTGTGSAVAKVLGSQDALFENLESYANNGPGLWLDSANVNYTVRNCYFHDSTNLGAGHSASPGLHLEINWAPGLVEHNVFVNNVHEGLAIVNSSGVTVRHNLFYRNRRGIVLSDFDRGTPFFMRDVRIEGNQFKDWREAAAIERLGPHLTIRTVRTLNVVADGNIYQPISSSWLSGWWGFAITTISGLQTSLGWEMNGRIGTVTWPID